MEDALNLKLLDRIQDNFPLHPRPFAVLGRELGLDEAEVLARLQDLSARRVIRQIGPVLEASTLGYVTVLAAARVTPQHLEEVAAAVSGFPEVTHNYGRNHAYNLWFALNAPSRQRLDEILARVRALEGVEAAWLLPSQRIFKIRVRFDLTGPGGPQPTAARGRVDADSQADLATTRPFPLEGTDRAIIRVLQEGIELTPQPFLSAARAAGCPPEELLARLERLLENRVIRRFGARLAHLEVGMGANAMVCWNVPSPRVEEAGATLAAFPQVSHCYSRPPLEDFAYNLYSMVHAHDQQELERVIAELAQATGIKDFLPLRTVKEYCKRAPRYFREDGRKRSFDAAP